MNSRTEDTQGFLPPIKPEYHKREPQMVPCDTEGCCGEGGHDNPCCLHADATEATFGSVPTPAELLKAADVLTTNGTHLSGRVQAAVRVAAWLRDLAANAQESEHDRREMGLREIVALSEDAELYDLAQASGISGSTATHASNGVHATYSFMKNDEATESIQDHAANEGLTASEFFARFGDAYTLYVNGASTHWHLTQYATPPNPKALFGFVLDNSEPTFTTLEAAQHALIDHYAKTNL
jgi:hypothetical protein